MADRHHSWDESKHESTESDLGGIPLGPRTRHLLALEFGDRKDFDNPRLEWRRLLSETLTCTRGHACGVTRCDSSDDIEVREPPTPAPRRLGAAAYVVFRRLGGANYRSNP